MLAYHGGDISSYPQVLLTLKGRFYEGMDHFGVEGYLRTSPTTPECLYSYIHQWVQPAFGGAVSGRSAPYTVVRSSGLSGYYHPLPGDFIHIFLVLKYFLRSRQHSFFTSFLLIGTDTPGFISSLPHSHSRDFFKVHGKWTVSSSTIFKIKCTYFYL